MTDKEKHAIELAYWLAIKKHAATYRTFDLDRFNRSVKDYADKQEVIANGVPDYNKKLKSRTLKKWNRFCRLKPGEG